MSEVYLNGKFLGEVDSPAEFVHKIQQERRSGVLAEQTNVYYDEALNAVFVESTRGRCRRPLIVVKDGVPALNERHIKQLEKGELAWPDLVAQGIIEFLDSSEEENSLIAFTDSELTAEHTHLEI